MDTEAPPALAASLGSLLRRTIRRSLERVANLAKEHSTKLLSALAWAALVSVPPPFIGILRYRRSESEPLPVLSYVAFLLLYASLYLRRRVGVAPARAMLRRGLGYAAVGLAAFLSALFFYSSFVSAVPLPLAILGWLLLLPAAYCFYRLIVLHLDEEEAAGDAT